jgi:hypothetical protein
MASIVIQMAIEDLQAVIAAWTHIKIYRSTDGLTGEYVEISEPHSRPVLHKYLTQYDFTDFYGDADFWYKSAYLNEGSGIESEPTAAFQGTLDAALDIMSVKELKINYLWGVNLTDDFGSPYPDSMMEFYLRSAVDTVEKKLDIMIRSKEITDEAHDLIPDDYREYMWIKTKEKPVQSITSVKLVMPANSLVQTFTGDDILLDQQFGVIQIVPPALDAGSVLLFSGAGAYPWARNLVRRIPHAWRVTYTAGFAPGEVPENIRHLIGMYAAMGPLNIAGDLIAGAGIASQSLSIDGLSQAISTTSSATNAGYGARILQYLKEIKDMLPEMRKAYHGIGFVVA